MKPYAFSLNFTTLIAFVFILLIHNIAHPSEDSSTENVVIINSYPHDKEAFTQGLIFYNGYLYESTGLYGKSSLRKVDLKTGTVEKIHNLSNYFFGEGITILDDKIYQLTWKSKIGIIYELDSFKVLDFFNYSFEGWGITNDGKNLIISNGTHNLYFYNPKSFKQVKRIKITYKDENIGLINELEYIDGKIYANIWRSNKIISIDPNTGSVIKWYDLSSLQRRVQGKNRIDVLNGIAFDKQSNRIFVTGKLWPKLFEIKLN